MKIGILGGSGLYEIKQFEQVEECRIETPFGDPSDAIMHGKMFGHDVYFLPRHGRGHVLLPSEINHRANIFALKSLGVTRVVSVSAVGSLRSDFRPRDICLPDQYFDRTKASDRHTFFGKGIVAHITFGDPVCNSLRQYVKQVVNSVIEDSGLSETVRVHPGGTYVNMEGPAFSTRAESNYYRKMGFDIIGMTSLAEAKLCREAEICYACIALVTDYDCWHEAEEDVSVEMVLETLRANTNISRKIIARVVELLPEEDSACPSRNALNGAIMTAPDRIPEAIKRSLAPIIGRYVTI
jgi:5'-methylthioadenosine phosphorylase